MKSPTFRENSSTKHGVISKVQPVLLVEYEGKSSAVSGMSKLSFPLPKPPQTSGNIFQDKKPPESKDYQRKAEWLNDHIYINENRFSH